jgi:hypothetical protein
MRTGVAQSKAGMLTPTSVDPPAPLRRPKSNVLKK